MKSSNQQPATSIEINNLCVSVAGKEILKGINLSVKSGELHAIMGRNGSGKSTLSNVIAGREMYEITDGEILFNGENIADWSPEKRACEGIFLSFQYPTVIPGVNNMTFLQAAVNSVRKYHGKEEFDAFDFLEIIKEKLQKVGLDERFIHRAVNEGFSGGEKKRNEILQLMMLEPKLAILDETDSGLDIDALKIVSEGVNSLRNSERSFILITHYQRMLNYIQPDFVHVLIDGKIVKSGGPELSQKLEDEGYSWVLNDEC